MTDGWFDVGLPISYGAKWQQPFVPIDRAAIPECGWPGAIAPRRPNAQGFSAATLTGNSNAGIACAKGTPVCPERLAMAVKKKSRLRLISNFHLHRSRSLDCLYGERGESDLDSLQSRGWDGMDSHGYWDDVHSGSHSSSETGHTGSMGRRCRTDSKSE